MCAQEIFHLHLISDATGETLLSAGRAAAAQYSHHQAVEHVYTFIQRVPQLEAVFQCIEKHPGIILYTTVHPDIGKAISAFALQKNLPCIAVLEPILQTFERYLHKPACRRASAQHAMNALYYERIAALDFSMDQDDGQNPEGLLNADIILLGVSRTSKTPTSLYLANRGIKTANIPLVVQVPLPQQLFCACKKALVVGLVASAERIAQLRQNRDLGTSLPRYTDRLAIKEELDYATSLCHENSWPIIDVTRRSIEETAAYILGLYSAFKEERHTAP